ncbi:hypothetical protein ABIB82_007575 [Bradyrhizobium sp. i1.8.4]
MATRRRNLVGAWRARRLLSLSNRPFLYLRLGWLGILCVIVANDGNRSFGLDFLEFVARGNCPIIIEASQCCFDEFDLLAENVLQDRQLETRDLSRSNVIQQPLAMVPDLF